MGFINSFCSKIGLTHVKRWACLLDNYKDDDAVEICKSLQPVLSDEPVKEGMCERD